LCSKRSRGGAKTRRRAKQTNRSRRVNPRAYGEFATQLDVDCRWLLVLHPPFPFFVQPVYILRHVDQTACIHLKEWHTHQSAPDGQSQGLCGGMVHALLPLLADSPDGASHLIPRLSFHVFITQPIVNPASFANPNAQLPSRPKNTGGGAGGYNGGSGGGGGGGGGRGGGFMSMTDLTGSGSECRAISQMVLC
jgi:uncharacterized membrane protein YgcG